MKQDELIKKVSGMTLSDIESGSDEEIAEKTDLTDEEIKAKLEVFAAVDRGLDESTEEVVGRLLVDAKDEKHYADDESWWKLY